MDSREARSLGMTAGPAWGRAGIATMSPEMRKRLGLAAAQFGTALVPSTGMTEFAGQMPDFSTAADSTAGVAKLPGFTENVAKGNYLDAFLQTMGAAGDAAQATAPLTGPAGLAFGAAIKAPKGLVNAIKVFGATGQKAKQIEAGIVKLNKGATPTAPQMAAVEEAARGGLRQARNAVVKQNPKLKGAPPHIASQEDHDAMVQSLAADIREGAANKPWYSESTDALRGSYPGDVVRQDRLLKAQGMASQQTPVKRDTGIAYRGMINAERFPDSTPPGLIYANKDTGEVASSPWTPGHLYNEVNDKVMSVARGNDVEPTGGKIGPFTTNMLTGGKDPNAEQIAQNPWMAQHLDEQGRTNAVVDTIMHQKYRYPDSAKASSTTQYVTPTLREAQQIVEPGSTAPISEVQAPVWLTQQSRLGGEGRISYKNAVDEMTGLMNVETTLGSNTGIEKVFRTAEMPSEQRLAFDKHMNQRVFMTPEGGSEILRMLGMPQQPARGGMGAYEGQYNPVTTYQPVMPGAGPAGKGVDDAGWQLVPREIKAEGLGWDGPGSVTMHQMVIPNVNFAMPLDDTTARGVTLAALLHQKFGFQKGQGWIRPYVPEAGHPTEASDWFQIDLGRPLTEDEARAFDAMGVSPIARGNAFGWLNLGGKPNQFMSKLINAADEVIGNGRYDLVHAPTQRNYFENDWKEGYDATQIDKAIEGLGPEWKQPNIDVHRALAPRLGAALEDWGKGNDIKIPDDFKRVIEAWEGSGRGRAAGLVRQTQQKLGVASPGAQQRPGLARPYDPFALED